VSKNCIRVRRDGSRGKTRTRLTFICSRLNDLTDAQIDTLVYPHRAAR